MGHLKPTMLLPGAIFVLIPGAILWGVFAAQGSLDVASPLQLRFWGGVALALLGLLLVCWSVALFATTGRGTPALWDPPKNLVAIGPYRHLRNPMIVGELLVLCGESAFFASWPIAIWTAIFFLFSAVYFPKVEEPSLERRFGEDYRRYKANVPRWLPRWRAWDDS